MDREPLELGEGESRQGYRSARRSRPEHQLVDVRGPDRRRVCEHSESYDRTLRFRIDGLLAVDPAPEPVVFDSQLEPATATFEVKDQPA